MAKKLEKMLLNMNDAKIKQSKNQNLPKISVSKKAVNKNTSKEWVSVFVRCVLGGRPLPSMTSLRCSVQKAAQKINRKFTKLRRKKKKLKTTKLQRGGATRQGLLGDWVVGLEGPSTDSAVTRRRSSWWTCSRSSAAGACAATSGASGWHSAGGAHFLLIGCAWIWCGDLDECLWK